MTVSIWGNLSMKNNVEFEMVCGDCGSLAIKIDKPVSASRKTIVYCGECGASRKERLNESWGPLLTPRLSPERLRKLRTKPAAAAWRLRCLALEFGHREHTARFRSHKQASIADALNDMCARGTQGHLTAARAVIGNGLTYLHTQVRCEPHHVRW